MENTKGIKDLQRESRRDRVLLLDPCQQPNMRLMSRENSERERPPFYQHEQTPGQEGKHLGNRYKNNWCSTDVNVYPTTDKKGGVRSFFIDDVITTSCVRSFSLKMLCCLSTSGSLIIKKWERRPKHRAQGLSPRRSLPCMLGPMYAVFQDLSVWCLHTCWEQNM